MTGDHRLDPDFAVMSFVCAFAWDYKSLIVSAPFKALASAARFRSLRPTSASWPRAKGRGRFVLLYELVFPIGLVAVGLVAVMGGAAFRLAMDVRHRRDPGPARAVPAAPRSGIAALARDARAASGRPGRPGLIESGRPRSPPGAAAGAAAGGRPPRRPASWSDLFGPTYLRRTLVVWAIWFAAYFFNYGLVVWLPTIYSTVFKLPLQQSLQYGSITQAIGFCGALTCALSIDRVGRRPWFAVAFGGRRDQRLVSLSCSGPSPGAGADLRGERSTSSWGQSTSRGLSLFAGALSDAHPRDCRRHGDGLAAVRIDPWAPRRRRHHRWRTDIGLSGFSPLRRAAASWSVCSPSRPRVACWKMCRLRRRNPKPLSHSAQVYD